ncbi:transglutaminase family protein [Demequina sp. TTPB684]|uniref:transglutaminase-like domain-containing protein n=1 Tax=unclassified Demequina TaxID=2620311 RepID=UPI001CF571EB|nr:MULTISPECIES: transglutaminase family protein [unclassified Demequina]MCB2413773.1 transglutaminase family protein [Demequina sp. TTPB684]UPU89319.1 transglutaminase family protein [Demequina sp. TMPB413]
MRRHLTASMTLEVPVRSDLVFAIAVADTTADVSERLSFALDGAEVPAIEIADSHGTRLHRVEVEPGVLEVSYEATVTGRGAPVQSLAHHEVRYLRPSRYAESDELAAIAFAEFEGLENFALLDGISSWVGTHLEYVPGSSEPTDGASQTYLARQGVCRDYAHLCVALLRARGVPARLVSAYAPGLEPMDFHAVCEALIDGEWWAVDPTTLAPRGTMVRIATGRDAADTAFLTTVAGQANLESLEVTATADALPDDDLTTPMQLG